MTTDVRAALRDLPRLDATYRARGARPCRVCATPAPFFDSVDFNKVCNEVDPYMFGPANISIEYFRCPNCEFVFADRMMDWNEDDFARLVYNDDYIKVDGEYADARPARMATMMARLLDECRNARILDYGSGSGRLAHYMADKGFSDVSSYDPFSSPARPSGRFDIVLCFEVIEHSANPRATLADIDSLIDPTGCLIFSQTLQPPDLDRQLGAWWYLAPRNGHISLFSSVTFERLGAENGMAFMAFRHFDHLYAMARVDRSPAASAALADTVTYRSVRLHAPDGDAPGWNEVENPPEGQLRWTSAPVIEWHVEAGTEAVFHARLSLRYAAEAEPGFAAGCSLAWGGPTVPVTQSGHRIWADVFVDDAAAPITLTTPDPVRPASRSPGGDERSLGLYVAVDSSGFSSGQDQALPR